MIIEQGSKQSTYGDTFPMYEGLTITWSEDSGLHFIGNEGGVQTFWCSEQRFYDKCLAKSTHIYNFILFWPNNDIEYRMVSNRCFPWIALYIDKYFREAIIGTLVRTYGKPYGMGFLREVRQVLLCGSLLLEYPNNDHLLESLKEHRERLLQLRKELLPKETGG